MSDSVSTQSNGIGFTGLLTICFIVLKLMGKISWSWVWVLCPPWIGAALAAVIIVVALIVFFLVAVLE